MLRNDDGLDNSSDQTSATANGSTVIARPFGGYSISQHRVVQDTLTAETVGDM